MFATAFDVVGHTIEIDKLQDKHISTLWVILQEDENNRLYREIYDNLPTSQKDFSRALLSSSEHDLETSATRAIINKCNLNVLGWLIIRSQRHESSEGRTPAAAMFLPRALRSERGTECMYYITRTLFDTLGYEKLEFRAGSLKEAWGPGGGQLGRSLIGVLSRQMLDRSRSEESDLYIVKKSEWPAVSLAVRAWLDSKVSTGVEDVLEIPS